MNVLVTTWHNILSEYSDKQIEWAYSKVLTSSKFMPVPADIVGQIENLTAVTEEDVAGYWLEYQNACRKASELTYYFPFTAMEANGKTQGENARAELVALYKGLSAPVKKYIGSYGMLMEKGLDFDKNEFKYEKPGFTKEVMSYRKEPGAMIDKSFEQLLIEGG